MYVQYICKADCKIRFEARIDLSLHLEIFLAILKSIQLIDYPHVYANLWSN